MVGMGFAQPEWAGLCTKRKFRFRFIIKDISGDGVSSLPPLKSARPGLSFREVEAQHLNETIYYPVKPEWKPINLTLYDLKRANENPVFAWIKRVYNPKNCSTWKPALQPGIKTTATLQMLDGCGGLLEEWVYEHAYPQSVDFGEVDMGSSDVMTCDITLRYDRAYITIPSTTPTLGLVTSIASCTPVMSFSMFGGVPTLFTSPVDTDFKDAF